MFAGAGGRGAAEIHVSVGSEQLAAMSLSMRGTDIGSEAIAQNTVDGAILLRISIPMTIAIVRGCEAPT